MCSFCLVSLCPLLVYRDFILERSVSRHVLWPPDLGACIEIGPKSGGIP